MQVQNQKGKSDSKMNAEHEALIAEAEQLLKQAGYDHEKRTREKQTDEYRNRKVLRTHDAHPSFKKRQK